MIEVKNRVRETISEEVMLARLAQSEQMREFFIEMWKQNPALAKQGGAKVRNLLTQLERGNEKGRIERSSECVVASGPDQVVANCDHLTKAKP